MVLKPVHIASALGVLIFATQSCGEKDYTDASGKPDGTKIYAANCLSCHGDKGDAGAGGAKNLRVSILSKQEVVSIVTHGSGAMMPFNAMLEANEIESVAEYAISLRD